MKTIKGPGIFLAQFFDDKAPYDTLDNLCKWAVGHGYKGIQLPTLFTQYFDLKLAAESDDYCQEIKGLVESHGLVITELSTHLQGQLIATHSAYDEAFDVFAPKVLKGNSVARREWATQQLEFAAIASRKLGLSSHATFSGALLWQEFYPWPQRKPNQVADGFKELARRWTPILNAFDVVGVDVCYEIHPGEDLHDGISFERFLNETNHHPRVNILYDPSHLLLQQMDYLGFIDVYKEFIKMFHVKDAEYKPSPRSGVYGGYSEWIDRPGRFRSVGDGQIDFKSIFSKLTQYDFEGWAVVEWECCLKHQEDGAKEGAQFVRDHIIRVSDKKFDDFAR